MKLLEVVIAAAALGAPAPAPPPAEKPSVPFECTASICVLPRAGFTALIRDYQLAIEQVEKLEARAKAAEGRCTAERGV